MDDISSSRTSKKRRRRSDGTAATDESPFDLLTLYQSDLGDRILSYASGAELCTLDILNKQFNALTTDQWNVVTNDRFGMNNGKEGWKIGTSLLRSPVYMHNIPDHVEDGGHPRIAANESIIVSVTDNIDYINQNKELEIRDATNFDYISTSHSPIENWAVSICGRVGSEIIVTSNNHQMCARSRCGNDIQRWQYRNNQDDFGIETLGCETHLIVPYDGRIYIYEINQEGRKDNKKELLSFKKEVMVEEGAGDEEGFVVRTIAWGPDNLHFIIGYPHKICVWKFDAANNEITLTKTIDVTECEIINVALAEDYIIGSCNARRAYIWDRNTGNLVSNYLTDVGADYDHHYDEYLPPLRLTCLGHILVCTSYIGCTLCIWDMKRRVWLKRHKQLDVLPEDNMYASDMVYLKEMNALVCTGGYTDAWIFPTNQSQYDKAISMGRRVELERRTRIHGMPEL